MSKSDRLKKQSQKQLEEIKKREQEEKAEREKPAEESRSAKKLRRQAKKLDSAASLVLKFLMLVPFLWSGLYYGGIFIVGITMEQMDDMPKRTALWLGIGLVFFVAGIILAFLSKYPAQLGAVLVGTAFFMTGAAKIVGKARERVGDGIGLTQEQQNLPTKWSRGLYPILGMTAISAVLFLIWLVKLIRKRRRQQQERDNAPVKSIIDD
ncbi:MAG: hypothetical protein IJ746_02045 [Ruminococcus sp.]|nr:hypothetical protein [Ruminococcus sp.]